MNAAFKTSSEFKEDLDRASAQVRTKIATHVSPSDRRPSNVSTDRLRSPTPAHRRKPGPLSPLFGDPSMAYKPHRLGPSSDRRFYGKSASSVAQRAWMPTLLITHFSGLLFFLHCASVAVTQPAIFIAFDGQLGLVWITAPHWISTAFCCLFWRNAYRLFDAKGLLIAATVILEAGNVLWGLSPSPGWLLAGSLLAGIGASGVLVGLIVMITPLQQAKSATSLVVLTTSLVRHLHPTRFMIAIVDVCFRRARLASCLELPSQDYLLLWDCGDGASTAMLSSGELSLRHTSSAFHESIDPPRYLEDLYSIRWTSLAVFCTAWP